MLALSNSKLMERSVNTESCNETFSFFNNENAHNCKKVDLGILSIKK